MFAMDNRGDGKEPDLDIVDFVNKFNFDGDDDNPQNQNDETSSNITGGDMDSPWNLSDPSFNLGDPNDTTTGNAGSDIGSDDTSKKSIHIHI